MFKKILLTALILMVTFQSSLVFATTKAFTLSVTIPVSVGVNNQQKQLTNSLSKSSPVLMQEARVIRENTSIVMRSIVIL